MIRDIMKSLLPSNDVMLLTRVITKEKKYEGYRILSHRWIDSVLHFKFRNFIIGIKEAHNSKLSFMNKLKLIFFFLDNGYLGYVLKLLKPDIIHLHGIDESTIAYLNLCRKLNIPHVLTLHGLIGIDKSIKASNYCKKFEKSLFESKEKSITKITVISSGIKRRILNFYKPTNKLTIEVILNASNINIQKNLESNKLDIRKLYNINQDKKILICIGNISERKNQIQVVEAYNLLSPSFKKNTILLFLGQDKLNGFIQQRILELNLQNNIILCGFVERNNIANYYIQSSLNIVASLDEGFGLSIIEGFTFGIPTVTFADLDVVDDLYYDEAMILATKRSTFELKNAIEKGLRKKWQKRYIFQHARNFTLIKMSSEYQYIYDKIIN